MAKKRRHHARRRHRRVGAAFKLGGKDTGVKLLAIGAGFLLGNAINAQVDKMLPKTADPVPVPTKNSSTLAAVGLVGIGGLLLLRKQSGTVGKAAGGVMLGAGLKRALSVLGVMTGYQSVPVIGRHRMAGYQSVPVIGASKIPAQLAGRTPPQLAGYRSAGSGINGYRSQGSGVMGAIGRCDGSGITADSPGYMG